MQAKSLPSCGMLELNVAYKLTLQKVWRAVLIEEAVVELMVGFPIGKITSKIEMHVVSSQTIKKWCGGKKYKR